MLASGQWQCYGQISRVRMCHVQGHVGAGAVVHQQIEILLEVPVIAVVFCLGPSWLLGLLNSLVFLEVVVPTS